VSASESKDIIDCIVIGAGPAGLSAARELQRKGRSVVVLDKGRGPGGRLSSRRTGKTRFDHGCKALTFREGDGSADLQEWIKAGAVTAWRPRLKDGSRAEAYFVGTPAMNEVIKHLARDLEVRFNCRVIELKKVDAGWEIIQQKGHVELTCRKVIVAIPAPQAIDLLAPIEFQELERIKNVTFAGIWALLLEGPHPDEIGFEAAIDPTPEISWLAAQAGKPGRTSDGAWVALASREWSIENLENDKQSVANALSPLCSKILGIKRPVSAIAHRWRFGLTTTPVGEDTLVDDDIGVAVAGDWCLGETIEDALQSGVAAGKEIDELLKTGPRTGPHA
jgi:renalase